MEMIIPQFLRLMSISRKFLYSMAVALGDVAMIASFGWSILDGYNVRPPATIAKLVQKTPISLWLMVLTTSYNELVTGAYKQTYNWGNPHCRN